MSIPVGEKKVLERPAIVWDNHEEHGRVAAMDSSGKILSKSSRVRGGTSFSAIQSAPQEGFHSSMAH